MFCDVVRREATDGILAFKIDPFKIPCLHFAIYSIISPYFCHVGSCLYSSLFPYVINFFLGGGGGIKVHTVHCFTYSYTEKEKTVKHPLPFYCFTVL